MRDLLIMDRLLVGISDDKTREELLCRGMEAASLHMKTLKSDEINKIKDMTKKKKKSGHDKYQPRSKNSPQCDDQKSVKKKCLFCLQIHVMKKEICPAWRKTCAARGERNHFKVSRRCKRQSVNSLAEDQLVLSKHYLGELPIRPEKVRLQMWNKTSQAALGKYKVKNPTTRKEYKVDFVIVDNNNTPLLSGVAAQKMNLISVHYDKFKAVNVVTRDSHKYFKQFSDAFKDMPGTPPGRKVHLTTIEGSKHVIRCARTLPESRKQVVRDELQRLVDAGIIVPVDEPTDWVSQISVAEKKSGIRICVDPRPLNHALKREHCKLPTPDNVLPELTTAKGLSVCDLKSGYLHYVLDHAPSLLTTFATPFGRFR